MIIWKFLLGLVIIINGLFIFIYQLNKRRKNIELHNNKIIHYNYSEIRNKIMYNIESDELIGSRNGILHHVKNPVTFDYMTCIQSDNTISNFTNNYYTLFDSNGYVKSIFFPMTIRDYSQPPMNDIEKLLSLIYKDKQSNLIKLIEDNPKVKSEHYISDDNYHLYYKIFSSFFGNGFGATSIRMYLPVTSHHVYGLYFTIPDDTHIHKLNPYFNQILVSTVQYVVGGIKHANRGIGTDDRVKRLIMGSILSVPKNVSFDHYFGTLKDKNEPKWADFRAELETHIYHAYMEFIAKSHQSEINLNKKVLMN